MSKLLFIMSQIPYPPQANGISVRYYPILQHLKKNHELYALVLGAQNDAAREYAGQTFNQVWYMQPETSGLARNFLRLKNLLSFPLPDAAPISYLYNTNIFDVDALRTILSENFACVIWVTARYAAYYKILSNAGYQGKVMIDFIDSPYLLMQRQANGKLWSSDILHKYETWKCKRWERSLYKKADAGMYISDVDVNAIAHNKNLVTKITVPNGIYLDSYTTNINTAIPHPVIGYLGDMSYLPNVEAVQWIYNNMFDELRRAIPQLNFLVIGRNPCAEIMALAQDKQVIVTGAVDNIWEYVNAVDVFVFPIFRGAGLKNKILESMYAAKPVVTSNIGNEGIDAVHGEQIIICHKPEDYLRQTLDLLQSVEQAEELGGKAKLFVESNFMWKNIAALYEKSILDIL